MKKNKNETIEVRYSKNNVMLSKLYNHKKDVLDVVLKDNETYTLEEIEEKINEFMNKEVN